jgi:hypothetical protein
MRGNGGAPGGGAGRDRIAWFVIVRAWNDDTIARRKTSQRIRRNGFRATVLIRFRRMCASR